MGTRTGDIDPAITTYLMRKLDKTAEEVVDIYNKRSGMLGVSGISSDARDIEAAAKEGNHRAQLAMEMFRYRVKKFIGAYAAAMNGVDMIVFTGGIGENASIIRSKTLEHMRLFDFKLDEAANQDCIRGKSGTISADNHPRVLVVHTNEERQIAVETLGLIDANA